MPKREEGEYIVSESGNWNVASDYSRFKIMKPLAMSDDYETLATFGTLDVEDELQAHIDLDVSKLQGFKRLVRCLIMVINNSIFAVKKNKRTELEKHRDRLKRIEKIIPALYKITSNQVNKTKTLRLKHEAYINALEEVTDIKAKINEPLNESDLIFTHKEEFDPKAYKDNILEQAKTRG